MAKTTDEKSDAPDDEETKKEDAKKESRKKKREIKDSMSEVDYEKNVGDYLKISQLRCSELSDKVALLLATAVVVHSVKAVPILESALKFCTSENEKVLVSMFVGTGLAVTKTELESEEDKEEEEDEDGETMRDMERNI